MTSIPTVCASRTRAGKDARYGATIPAISADGDTVAFSSLADNLVRGVAPQCSEIFTRDLNGGAIQCVSVSERGRIAREDCWNPALSTDGSVVAFTSRDHALVPDDQNLGAHVLLRDRNTGQTERVSVSSSGRDANNEAYWPAISGDGRFVAFVSAATNLVPGATKDCGQIYVRDRKRHETLLVSATRRGTPGNGDSMCPSISADGRYVAFSSRASNLVPGDGNKNSDVFVRDLGTGNMRRVSVSSMGRESRQGSYSPCISADGRTVAFECRGTELANGAAPGVDHVYCHDLDSGRTSLASDGTIDSRHPSLSADGWHVAYVTHADPGGEGVGVATVLDRMSGRREAVAEVYDGDIGGPLLSADGGKMAYVGSTNGVPQVMVADLGVSGVV